MEQEIAWLLRDKYAGQKTDAFYSDIERLKEGEPLAYVIGWVPFLGTKIYLDSKPLIPRTETEYGVGELSKELKEKNISKLNILDLCAGSGCIGVALLHEIQHVNADFVEMNPSHHATITKNIIENGINPARTQVLGGDLFENIHTKYDVVVCNPPYIDPLLERRIQKNVIRHEPHEALFGGEHGTEIIKRVLKEVSQHLNKGGILYLEHEPEQQEEIIKLAPHTEFFTDQFGVVRFSRITF